MKLSTWTKPGTNETRIYFNGVSSEVKVFAIEQDGLFMIRFSARMYSSQQDAIMDRIDRELEEMNGGERVVKWADLLSLVK